MNTLSSVFFLQFSLCTGAFCSVIGLQEAVGSTGSQLCWAGTLSPASSRVTSTFSRGGGQKRPRNMDGRGLLPVVAPLAFPGLTDWL